MELDCLIEPISAKTIELRLLRSDDESEFTRILFQPQAGFKLREAHRRTWPRPRQFNHGSLTIDTTLASVHPKTLPRPPEVAQVLLDDPKGPLRLRVFVDKSVADRITLNNQERRRLVRHGRKLGPRIKQRISIVSAGRRLALALEKPELGGTVIDQRIQTGSFFRESPDLLIQHLLHQRVLSHPLF
jgi:hypothetical protein